ncbi:hypothetical protein BDZ91DRAFT_85230 [Kalaharituber pfeilii]|nr:hypothetical protein BDZ91DRAFT_85230 [Kalaharituber pfeilii]
MSLSVSLKSSDDLQMLGLDIVVVEGLEMMTVASFEGSGRDDELCGSKFADDTSLTTPSLSCLDPPRTLTIGFPRPWPCVRTAPRPLIVVRLATLCFFSSCFYFILFLYSFIPNHLFSSIALFSFLNSTLLLLYFLSLFFCFQDLFYCYS